MWVLRSFVRACGTSLVRWMALQCAKRTGRRHGVLIINLESQLRLAAEVTGNSLSALLASHSYHVHRHICLCLRTLGLYIMIVNLTFRHCFNVSDGSVFILTKTTVRAAFGCQ